MGTPVCTYDSSRSYLVDSYTPVGEAAINKNFLVRGNMPLADDGTIAYDQMKEKFQEFGIDLTVKKLVIISLIDNQGELNDLELEFEGVGKPNYVGTLAWPPYSSGVDCFTMYGTEINGDATKMGSLVWFPCQGCTDDSNCALVENPLFDFCGFVAWLQGLLVSSSDTVFYYHCEHGHDRTSAVTGAYQQQWFKYSLEQVLTEPPPNGAKAFSHDWECNYEALVKWFATTLPTE